MKKRGNLSSFYEGKTPEEVAEWQRQATEKRLETLRKKKALVEEARKKAQQLLPELIAQDLMLASDAKYIPAQATINKLKELLGDGKAEIEKVRSKFFKDITDDTWHKLMKYVFKSHISQVEDVALSIVQAKQRAIKDIKGHIRFFKKELRELEKANANNKKWVYPAGIRDRLMAAEAKLYQLEADFGKTLHQIEAVGEKNKSPSLHIHLGTPRPAPKQTDASIDVTPTTTMQALLDKRRSS